MTGTEKLLEELVELEKAKADARTQVTLLIVGVVAIVLSYVLCF